jgi:hypothetical protein
VTELTKLIQAGAPGKSENEKLSFNLQNSYHDLKQIIQTRFLNNKEFLGIKLAQLTQIGFPMMAPTALTAGPVTFNPAAAFSLLTSPAGLNSILPQVQNSQVTTPQVTTTQPKTEAPI